LTWVKLSQKRRHSPERSLDIGFNTSHITMMFWFRIAIGIVFFCGALATVRHLFTLNAVEEGIAK
jgi:hypothetical protein